MSVQTPASADRCDSRIAASPPSVAVRAGRGADCLPYARSAAKGKHTTSLNKQISPCVVIEYIGHAVVRQLKRRTVNRFTSTTIPMYIAESAPAYVRGRLVSTNVLMIACGQFIANVVDGIFSYNKENGWRYMLGIGALPSIIQFVGFCFMPESPRWLILKGREDEARMVLQKIRGETDIEEEFDSVKSSCLEAKKEDSARKQSSIIWKMIKTPSVRRALIVGCGLQMVQQLAGINTVMYYSATIITMSGVRSETAAIWLSAVMAAVNFAFSFVGLYLVEKIGRRPLTITSLVGTIASLIWLAVGFDLSAENSPQMTTYEGVAGGNHCASYRNCNSCVKDLYCGYCYVNAPTLALNGSCLPVDYNKPVMSLAGRCNSTNLPGQLTWAYDFCPTQYAWMPLVGLILYLICFAPGMGPMPWTVNSEIYPIWARSTGNSAATFVNWVFNLAVSMSFLSLTEVLTKEGTFGLYAGLACLGLIFIAFFLPETKGKSLEEVEGVFAKPWCGSEGATVPFGEKTVQYVHIRGLNRDGRDSEIDSPE
ncbi:Proton myo-inositol cotransporter [Lamellibrachia satsuma]|nr:Proton myo-inositol cotransporter [Lamellibrachia satsuma]